MPHFAIESLGHGTGGFLDSITSSPIVTGLTGSRTVTGTATSTIIPSRGILDNILSGIGLPLSQKESIFSGSIFNLQEQGATFTNALNEIITVREEDIKKINENFRNLAISSDVAREQPKPTAQTLTDSLKFGLTNLQAAIGGTGLLIGIAVVGFILLKK